MRTKLNIGAVIGVLILSSFSTTAFSDGTYDEQWSYPGIQAGAYAGYVKQVAPDMRFLPDSALGNYRVYDAGLVDNTCSSLADKNCELTDRQLYFATLPMCTGEIDTDCIMQVSASIDGTPLQVKTIGVFPTVARQGFIGDPSRNLPTGATSTLVEIPAAPHPGGDLYLVTVRMAGQRSLDLHMVDFSPPSLTVSIFAIAFKAGTYSDILLRAKGDVTEKINPPGFLGDGSNGLCVARTTTQCAVPYPLPESVSFGLQLRLLNTPVSWIQGRFKLPSVSLSKDAHGNTVLNVSAQPIRVPALVVSVAKDKLVPAMYGLVFPTAGTSIGSSDQGSDSVFSFPSFLAWLAASDNHATVQPTIWSFRNAIANYGDYDARTLACFGDPSTQNGFLGSSETFRGLVTTNASQYIEGPPKFNEAEQTLDYKVAAPHFTPTGEVFKGTYDLVIDSNFARCIYGFSKAPIQATISVTSETGEKDVATTVVGERDGLLYLSASAFTFSAPTIRVKLTQSKPTPTPTSTLTLSPTSSPKPISPKPPTSFTKPGEKSTITCVKGKTIKKVTALKPVCPSGFKKR